MGAIDRVWSVGNIINIYSVFKHSTITDLSEILLSKIVTTLVPILNKILEWPSIPCLGSCIKFEIFAGIRRFPICEISKIRQADRKRRQTKCIDEMLNQWNNDSATLVESLSQLNPSNHNSISISPLRRAENLVRNHGQPRNAFQALISSPLAKPSTHAYNKFVA